MFLPKSIEQCLQALEDAGHAAYVVGGCVRDACLGLTPNDYDMCTSATPEQTQEVFRDYPLGLEGRDLGAVVVFTEDGPVEITTFRTEGDYRDNRHPEWVAFVPDVESDLARRDFTVNAMAYSPVRGYADPFHGREDLKKGILRTVGDPQRRFREDSLRILRGARFAARFGLALDPETEEAMGSLSCLLDNLTRERVFEELCKLLPLLQAGDVIRFTPVLTAAIPELTPMVGFDQHSPHHAYDLYTHVAHVVAGVPEDMTLRWAALLHDIGKAPAFTRDADGRGHFYGHAPKGAEMADAILRRLKAPTALRQQVVLLIEKHMTRLRPDRKYLRRQIGQLGWETTMQMLALQEADMGSKGIPIPEEVEVFDRIREILRQLREENPCLCLKDLEVKGNDLMALGFSGKSVGVMLNLLLEQVLEENLPNDRRALLTWAEREKDGGDGRI